MNKSLAIFLFNDAVRLVDCSYEPDTGAKDKYAEKYDTARLKSYMFKTLDQSIVKGDLLVVPTGTRHNMTVVRVEEVDLEPDFDSPIEFKWIVQKVDQPSYHRLLGEEELVLRKIRKAETRRRRREILTDIDEELREDIKALPLTTIENGEELPAPPPPGQDEYGSLP